MSGSRTSAAAKNAPQSQKAQDRKADSRVPDALRKSPTISPGVALQALRMGGRLSPEQAAALSHAIGNSALAELLSASRGPELLRRPLPQSELSTPPLSVPDSAPQASLMTGLPVWGGESNGGASSATGVSTDIGGASSAINVSADADSASSADSVSVNADGASSATNVSADIGGATV